ncbi:hypothetical protein [Synoicihabitans lomoniglobus]|uniref:Uncharacterized protein n=1 Tax=Synoicihabitans lomoniglobus TaxID=2909285 RepID=A0AAF0A0N4_9BACT|nr:hypothetical protein [Opitutaceae bacterium LMO-M01]WED65128.1 hypothetical protein PXH66_22550 [Opitutaceae bacterium LMO-M01]
MKRISRNVRFILLFFVTGYYAYSNPLGVETHGVVGGDVIEQNIIELDGDGYALVPSGKRQIGEAEEGSVTISPYVAEGWERSTIVVVGAFVIGYEMVESIDGQKAAQLVWLRGWPEIQEVKRLGLSIELGTGSNSTCAFHSLIVTANKKEKWWSLSTSNSELIRITKNQKPYLGEKIQVFPSGKIRIRK